MRVRIPSGPPPIESKPLPPLLGGATKDSVLPPSKQRQELFRRSRYRALMEGDANFSSWIENIARGSKINAETTLRRMGRVCSLLRVTPKGLAGMSRGEAGAFLFSVVS